MVVAPVVGYATFVTRVPNGAKVTGVKAIGHINVSGGGAPNNFGTDFNAMGAAWTTDLCKTDSDGDGQTNGEELGDPCCEWDTTTAISLRWTVGVSNPGDGTSTTNAALLASVDCSKSSSSSSSEDSASTSGSAGSTTPITAGTSGSSTLAISSTAGLMALLVALGA
ncbi:hypothetical protein PRIC2_011327 [Phytophthora ramorum]